jgi:RNA polymerase sigma factor (sigma-70 family)
MYEDTSEAFAQKVVFWDKAYKTNFNPLCSRTCSKLTNGNLAQAEDTVSEAFVRAMDYAKNPDAIENLFGYLWITVKRVWIANRIKENTSNIESLDEIRSKRDPQYLEPTVEPDVLRLLENEDLEAEMNAKQGPLTSHERSVFKLYLQGYKCREIADRLQEDVRLTRSDLNAVKAKVRYRINKGKAKTKGVGR